MEKMKLLTAAGLLTFSMNALATLSGTPPSGGMLTINASDSGWYDVNGLHNESITNYTTGDCNYVPCAGDTRNFFVFDLSSVTTPVTSAILRVYNYGDNSGLLQNQGYMSQDPFETYNLTHVSTDVSTLTTSHAYGDAEGLSIWDDLGTGNSYGSYNASNADNDSFIELNLNAAALLDINGANGLFALGGYISTLDGVNNYERLFGWSDGFVPELILTTADVPAPATLGLLGLGLLGLTLRKKHA
jgi:hypothetical protein